MKSVSLFILLMIALSLIAARHANIAWSSERFQVNWERHVVDEGKSQFYSVSHSKNGDIWAVGTKIAPGSNLVQGLTARIDTSRDIAQKLIIDVQPSRSVTPFRHIPLEDGGFIVVGWTPQAAATQITDGWMARYGAAGQPVWVKTFGGDQSDRLSGIALLGNGSVLAVGRSQSNHPDDWDAWALCVDLNGNLRWQRFFGKTTNEGAISVAAMPGGGFAFCGWKAQPDAGADDAWVVRCDADGNLLWETIWGEGMNEVAYHLACTESRQLIVVGHATQADQKANDGLILCLDDTGKVLWHRILGGSLEDRLNAVVATPDQQLFMVGSKSDPVDGRFDGWCVHLDLLTMNTNEKVVGTKGQDRFFDISMGEGDKAVIAGLSAGGDADSENASLIEVHLGVFLPFYSLDPQSGDQWERLGRRLHDAGAYQAAIRAYGHLLALHPTSSSAHYHRGRSLEKLGDPARAISEYDTALTLNPYNRGAYNARLKLLREKKRGPSPFAPLPAISPPLVLKGLKAKMAFVDDGRIFIVLEDGKIVDTGIKGENPSLSADGLYLAYTLTRIENQTVHDDGDARGQPIGVVHADGICLVDLKNGNRRRLAEGGQCPVFSPNGNYLAAISKNRIIISNIALGDQTVIGPGCEPVWLENDVLVFQSWRQILQSIPQKPRPQPLVAMQSIFLFDFNLLPSLQKAHLLPMPASYSNRRIISQTNLCGGYTTSDCVAYIQRETEMNDLKDGRTQTYIVTIDRERNKRQYDISPYLNSSNTCIQAFALNPAGDKAVLAIGPGYETIFRNSISETALTSSGKNSELFIIPLAKQNGPDHKVLYQPAFNEKFSFITDLDFWDNDTIYLTSVDKERTVILFDTDKLVSVGLMDMTPDALKLFNMEISAAELKAICGADAVYQIKLSGMHGSEVVHFAGGHSVFISSTGLPKVNARQ